jgi:hypothetical protein
MALSAALFAWVAGEAQEHRLAIYRRVLTPHTK